MDLNYLLHRHQISLMQAKSATSVEARRAHSSRASSYAAEIARFQSGVGATNIVEAS